MIKSGKVGVRSDGDYDYEVFWLECDKCHECYGYDDDIDQFKDAVKLKKAIGFKSFKTGGKWYEYCPKCAAKIAERREGDGR